MRGYSDTWLALRAMSRTTGQHWVRKVAREAGWTVNLILELMPYTVP